MLDKKKIPGRSIASASAVLALLLLMGTFVAQAQETHEYIPLREGISVIQVGDRKTNIGVIDVAGKLVVVDTYMGSFAETMLEVLDEQVGRNADLVINTHFHGDHLGGNAALAERGALILAHENARATMNAPNWSIVQKRMMPAANPATLPHVAGGDLSIHLGDLELRVLHLPEAHTAGDLVVVIEDRNLIFAGDILAVGYPTLLDARDGASIDGLITAQTQLLEMMDEETLMVPGHGAIVQRPGVHLSLQFLHALHNRLQAMARAGAALTDVLDAEIMPALPDVGQASDPRRAGILVENAWESMGQAID